MFRRRRQPPPGLHRCALCDGDCVVPVNAEALDGGQRSMLLRCGQCGVYRDVVVTDAAAKIYDLDLERGMAEIAAAVRREDRDRMVSEVRTFIVALERDLIHAGDFARG